jgi:o-succinylbenzoate synthase
MIELRSHPLKFHFEAGTSRGVLTEKTSYFLQIKQDGKTGLGEAGPLRGLSPEFEEDCLPAFQRAIAAIKQLPENAEDIDACVQTIPFELPSLRAALEMALLDYFHAKDGIYFDNSFSRGKSNIPINGLIWMGSPDFMRQQIADKLAEGYSCLKLKIGAIDFEQEIDIISEIRSNFPASDLTIRVDANGAFSTKEAPTKLDKLAKLEIHSIEQPIQAGQWKAMRALCKLNILPIALDEELIQVHEPLALLERIQAPYMILKPTLVGGFAACNAWIQAAESVGTHWWITSALESNIGLQAVAQFTGEYRNSLPQGLGTGKLYTNNFDCGLSIQKGHIYSNPHTKRTNPFA